MADSSEVFAALADPLRLTIYRVVDRAPKGVCVAELVDILQRPQYAVSRALRHLERAGVLSRRREGKLVYYQLGDRRGTDGSWAEALRDAVRFGLDHDTEWPTIRDRLRWRLEIRRDDRCVVTYRDQEETMGEKTRVLFVCVHNSARSQMAEEFLRRAAGDEFEVESAGLEPGKLNPRVVTVLAEEGIDIRGKDTRDVFDVYRAGKTYGYVITVCSREAEEKCPVFPGPSVRMNWPFDDPSQFSGSDEEVLAQTRRVRDEVKAKVEEFVAAYHRRHGEAI